MTQYHSYASVFLRCSISAFGMGPIGRLLRRTTLRENEGETRFLTSNLLKVVVQFGDAANRKTNLETVYRGFLMSGVA